MNIVRQVEVHVKNPSPFPHTPYPYPAKDEVVAKDRVQLKTTVAKDKSKLKTERRFRFFICRGRQICSSWVIPDEHRKALLGMLALHLKDKDSEQSRKILRNLVYLQSAVEQIAGTMTKRQLCGWVAARIFGR